MKMVLVTGAAGFIGSHLVEYLVQHGYSVRATDIPGMDLTSSIQVGADVVTCDLFDTYKMREALSGIDCVVHTAGVFDLSAPRERLQRINVEGVEQVCKVCLDKGIERFVHLSTSAVYGRPSRVPIVEDDPKRPLEPYGITKWEGEKVAFKYQQTYGLPVTALRPTLVYGPRSRYGHALYIAASILLKLKGLRGLPMVEGGPINHSVHVSDVCHAVACVLEQEAAVGQAFNVADEEPLTLEQYCRAIIEPVGLTIVRRVHYYPTLWRGFVRLLLFVLPLVLKRLNRGVASRWRAVVEAYHLEPVLMPKADRSWLHFVLYDQYYDTARLRSLGWTPRYPRFRQGIRETIQWYVANRWIPQLPFVSTEMRDSKVI